MYIRASSSPFFTASTSLIAGTKIDTITSVGARNMKLFKTQQGRPANGACGGNNVFSLVRLMSASAVGATSTPYMTPVEVSKIAT